MRFGLGDILWTLLKLAIVCFLVGVVLYFLGVEPMEFWGGLVRWLDEFVRDMPGKFEETFGWTWPFIVLGAGVVLPIYLIRLAIRLLRNR